jgi:hypothetical protein
MIYAGQSGTAEAGPKAEWQLSSTDRGKLPFAIALLALRLCAGLSAG